MDHLTSAATDKINSWKVKLHKYGIYILLWWKDLMFHLTRDDALRIIFILSLDKQYLGETFQVGLVWNRLHKNGVEKGWVSSHTQKSQNDGKKIDSDLC